MGQLEPHVPIYVIVVYVYEPSCDYQTAGAERSIGAMRERAAHPMLLASTWHTSRQGCTEETLQPPAHNFFFRNDAVPFSPFALSARPKGFTVGRPLRHLESRRRSEPFCSTLRGICYHPFKFHPLLFKIIHPLGLRSI